MIIDAVAEQHRWEQNRHQHYLRIARRLRGETGGGGIFRLFASARALGKAPTKTRWWPKDWPTLRT